MNFEKEIKEKNKNIVNRRLIDKLQKIQIDEYFNKRQNFYEFISASNQIDQTNCVFEEELQCDIYSICDGIQQKQRFMMKEERIEESQRNKVSKNGRQSLLQVAALYYDYRVLKYVLEYVKDVNYNRICTPLHQAISSQESKTRYRKVELLIKNKADVNKNSLGTYAIQLAWEYKQYKIVELLIRSGAKTDVLDLRNERTIDDNLIKQKNNKLIEAKLESLDKKYKDSKVFFEKIQYIVHSYKFIKSNQRIKQKIIENKSLQQSVLDIIQVYFKNMGKRGIQEKIQQRPPVQPLLIETMKYYQKNLENYITLDYRDKTAEQKEKEILGQGEDPDCEFCKEKCTKKSNVSNRYNAICCFRVFPREKIGNMRKSGKEYVDGFVGLCVCDKCDEEVLEGWKDEKKVYIEFKNNEIFLQDQNNRMND